MEEQKKSGRVARELLSWGKMLLCSVVLALLINNVFIVNAAIISGSMETTIMTGDRVFGNRLAYVGGEPKRFDIVIFQFPDAQERVNYVKRIIGMPGEKVEIRDGKVYINDSEEPLPDDFVQEEPMGDYGPFYVPEGHYFLLGDNRNNSFDSKDWQNHFVARNKILGKLFASYYPHIRLIEDYDGQ